MSPVQNELYHLMKFEAAREAAIALDIRSKQAFRTLGRSVARLLQFVSNPALLSSEIGFAHAELLKAVLAEGEGRERRWYGRTRVVDASKGRLCVSSIIATGFPALSHVLVARFCDPQRMRRRMPRQSTVRGLPRARI